MLSIKVLEELKEEQGKLDRFIVQKKNLDNNYSKSSFVRTKVALLVEIGELANELATFKHWKKQKDINWEKAKEELIDCLHFYLGWVNELEIDFTDYKFQKLTPESDFNELLLAFFSETNSFSITKQQKITTDSNENKSFLSKIKAKKNQIIFYHWLMIFEELAQKLGMDSEEKIKDEYMKKNRKNWMRQQQNY
jgi:dimeric dUTPase (all-alpha-NTP-PPase superfamily)